MIYVSQTPLMTQILPSECHCCTVFKINGNCACENRSSSPVGSFPFVSRPLGGHFLLEGFSSPADKGVPMQVRTGLHRCRATVDGKIVLNAASLAFKLQVSGTRHHCWSAGLECTKHTQDVTAHSYHPPTPEGARGSEVQVHLQLYMNLGPARAKTDSTSKTNQQTVRQLAQFRVPGRPQRPSGRVTHSSLFFV